MDCLALTQVLWDYMRLDQKIEKADCIVALGCYNEDVPRRAAELYRQGYAPWVLFTGALGRNTKGMWQESEASRFARIAMEEGVPESAILLEEQASNTGENLIFSRRLLEERSIPAKRILAVQKPYMERRIAAAFPVYWPDAVCTVTSPRQTLAEYLAGVSRWGRTAEDTIHMIVGDTQRIWLYAQKGYQIPQQVPPSVMEAYRALVAMGYTRQVIPET